MLVVKAIQKSNPNISLAYDRDWRYDILPASLYHGQKQLFSVPKGMVFAETRMDTDGSIISRGYKDIIRMLGNLIDRRKVINAINRAECSMVI
jgi:hypothetical protein